MAWMGTALGQWLCHSFVWRLTSVGSVCLEQRGWVHLEMGPFWSRCHDGSPHPVLDICWRLPCSTRHPLLPLDKVKKNRGFCRMIHLTCLNVLLPRSVCSSVRIVKGWSLASSDTDDHCVNLSVFGQINPCNFNKAPEHHSAELTSKTAFPTGWGGAWLVTNMQWHLSLNTLALQKSLVLIITSRVAEQESRE